MPNGQVGVRYDFQLRTNSDGDHFWSVLDAYALPLGLTLNDSGIVAGTPFEWGTFVIPVSVTVYGGGPTEPSQTSSGPIQVVVVP